MVFPKFRYDGDRWFWSWKDPKKCVNVKYFTTNLRNLQNTLHAPFHPFHFCSIVMICTQHLEFMTWMKTLPPWVLIGIKTPLCNSSFCYHWTFSMVFRGTITIEWNGQRQPLKTMVFRWFWVSQPLVTMVFRWLATIGPTMEWLHTIVEVYRWLMCQEKMNGTKRIGWKSEKCGRRKWRGWAIGNLVA